MVLTYGRRKAMSGNCDEAALCGWVSFLGRDLARYLLISLAIHCACLFMHVAAGAFSADKLATGQVGGARLQVHLVPREAAAVADPGPTAAPVEKRVAARPLVKPGRGGRSPYLTDSDPELVSEVALEIDDFRVTGFMILALEIDDEGVPGNAEVVYSDLPAETVELLVARFTAARFKPAVKRGQVTAAPILMRINVE
jgi:hypothetical protein